ncbi:hypothetical protein RDI58_023714 [Solanum bulbocastanum]|uniref:Sucrose phosphatase-like domain-containing protein n=1 Tax=Solanum bulbocastanum TaxID=147425 RepID=A0AAN8Y2U0_SOLBU
MSVGTEIAYGNAMVPDDGWEIFLNNKWDRKKVTEETSKFPELSQSAVRNRAATTQGQFLCSERETLSKRF